MSKNIAGLVCGRAIAKRRLQLEKLDERSVLSTFSGVAFNDVDGDGIQGAGETGIAGFTVFHDIDGNSILDAGEENALTAADGSYSFSFPDTGPTANHYGSIIIPAGDATGRWLNTTNIYQRTGIYSGVPVAVVMNFGFRFVPYAGNFFPVEGETLVNHITAGEQGTPFDGYNDASTIAADQFGNYVVAWVSPAANLQDQVSMRMFNADGTPKTSEILVATVTRKPGANPKMPAVAVSDDGSRFAVAWNNYSASTSTIAPFVRAFDANGTPIGSIKQVSPYKSNEQYGVTGIAMDGNGDFAVLMTGGTVNKFGGNPGITHFQRFNNSGAAAGNRVQVVDAALMNGKQGIAMDGAGNFVVVWQETSGIFAQRYSASGSKVGSGITVVMSTSAGADRDPSVAMNSAGRFVVTWISGYYNPGFTQFVTAQVFGSAGQLSGASVDLGSSMGGESPGTDIDADGNVTVAWTARPEGNQTTNALDRATEIRVRRLNAAGELSDQFIVNTTIEGVQVQPSVAATDTDRFVVTWNGRGIGDSSGVFTQRYSLTAPAGLSAEDLALIEYLEYSESIKKKVSNPA